MIRVWGRECWKGVGGVCGGGLVCVCCFGGKRGIDVQVLVCSLSHLVEPSEASS